MSLKEQFTPAHHEQQDVKEQQETLAEHSFALHDATKDLIAQELHLDEATAEQEVGTFFVDKVEADLKNIAPQDELLADAGAALISGVNQLDSNGGDADATLLHNPVLALEQAHPDVVTEVVAEFQEGQKTSVYAQFIAIAIEKAKTLVDKMTPVRAANGQIMSAHSKKYQEFTNLMGEARIAQTGNDWVNLKHGAPTMEEFAAWKKTGQVAPHFDQSDVYVNPFASQLGSHEPPAPSTMAPPNPDSSWSVAPNSPPPPPAAAALNKHAGMYAPVGRWTPQAGWAPLAPERKKPEKVIDLSVAPPPVGTLNKHAGMYAPTPSAPEKKPEEEKINQKNPMEKYLHDIQINPANSSEALSAQEVATRMELDRTVKRAPRFIDQIDDPSRRNQVVYINGSRIALHTNTSHETYRSHRDSGTEQAAISTLHTFLQEAAKSTHWRNAEMAKSMLDNLTFIGEKEYKEATAGIADYWKAELDKNKSLQILAVAGEIAKAGNYTDGNLGGESQIKSDDWLLENILANFSDEEMQEYAGRIVVDVNDARPGNPGDIKVVLLDDWTISGKQMKDARDAFIAKHPQLADAIEIQLIAANEDRIKADLVVYDDKGAATGIPVRSYYVAHHSDMAGNDDKKGRAAKAHITGFHSSVDYHFENAIAEMIPFMSADAVMPASTNIVRPYRYDGVTRSSFVQRDRVRSSVKSSRGET